MLLFLKIFDVAFFILLAVSYLYQLVYAAVGLTSKRSFAEPEAGTEHKFAAVVSARNEEGVIGELIASLRRQRYPADKLDIFVVADNCTDRTAEAAQNAGAVVFAARTRICRARGTRWTFSSAAFSANMVTAAMRATSSSTRTTWWTNILWRR